MVDVPLRLGPLSAAGFDVGRSGVRWLRHTGSICKPGDVIAFCNIGLIASQSASPSPFNADRRDLQAAFITPVGGRLRMADGMAYGGMMDQLASQVWSAEDLLCVIETDRDADASAHPEQARLLILSGRRLSEIVEVRSGPLSGWHDLSRAWSGEDHEGGFGTLLGVGSCDLTDVLLGPGRTCAELIAGAPGGVQIVRALDEPLLPCAPVLTEQLERTPQQCKEIAADLAESLAGGDDAPSASDMIFVGALLAGLSRRALEEQHPILTRSGLRQAGPPDVVVMSLRAEASRLIRHRRLGYTINVNNYRIREGGPWLRPWLVRNFEPVYRTVDDVKADLRVFLTRVGPNVAVLMLNTISDAPGEDIQTYHGLGEPLSATVDGVNAKERNLMLHDLAKTEGIAIVDVEAISAQLGQRQHTMDTMHHSGAIQAEIREELLAILAARKVAGFHGGAFRRS